MVALNAHDARRGYSEIRRAEIPHSHQVSRDECVLQRHQNVQSGLGVRKHVGGIKERSERRGLAGGGLLQQVVRHLFLPGGLQVALVVRFEIREEGRDIDDIAVGGYRQRLGDFCRDEDVDILDVVDERRLRSVG